MLWRKCEFEKRERLNGKKINITYYQGNWFQTRDKERENAKINVCVGDGMKGKERIKRWFSFMFLDLKLFLFLIQFVSYIEGGI